MKRGIYRLRKWYFDFLSPASDYCFVYFADVHVLGATFRSLTVHLARHGRGNPVTRSIPVGRVDEVLVGPTERSFRLSAGRITIGPGSCAIDVSSPGCSVRLDYESLRRFDGEPVTISTGGRSRIIWKPLHVKCAVSGRLTIDGETIDVRGFPGYVDYLESSYLPPGVPVRTLYWGRVHHPEIDLVYMRAGGGPGTPAWSQLTARAGDSLKGCGEVTITDSLQSPRSESPGYDAHAVCGSFRIRLAVRHAAIVQESSFIDHQEVKSRLARSILKKLTRDPRSTKWLSRADIAVDDGIGSRVFRDIPLIDEFALL